MTGVEVKIAADGERYLVAGTDAAAGDVLLSEYPVVAGPLYTRSKPVCLQCLKLVKSDCYRCSRCNFPMCDEACEQGRWHAIECHVIQDSEWRVEIENWDTFCPIYSCITVLRTLLLKESDPAGWRIVDTLMDHDKERAAKDSPTWQVHELLVLNVVQQFLRLTQFSRADVRRAIGILRTNSVKLESRVGFGEGVAVYPTYSYANHSCLCNTHTKKFRDLRLDLVAQVPIKQGETVWTRYTTPQIGNFQRVADIQKTWHFQCSCPRCQDPTEFGTMMSGLMCGKDCPGVLLPIHSNIIGSPWSCNQCKRKTGVTAVQNILCDVTKDIGTNREESNSTLLNLITKYENSVLHPNHYLLIGIKEIVLQRLMSSLNNKENYAKMSDQQKVECLELRTKLFREIVSILSVVDAAGSPWEHKLHKMEAEEDQLKSKLEH